MTLNEHIVAYALAYYGAEADYAAAFEPLEAYPPASEVLRKLMIAREMTVLRESDMITEYLAAGGTEDEYARVLEEPPDMIIPATVREAVRRLTNQTKAGKLYAMLDEYRQGRLTDADLQAAMLEMDTRERHSVSMRQAIHDEETRTTPPSVDTGFDHTDRVGGLARRQVTILAARPGVGKSDYALAVARNVMRRGGCVYFASVEMDRDQIVRRLRRGEVGREPLLTIRGRMQIDDRGSVTVPQIAAASRMGRYDLVIVDYLQILNYPHRTSGLYERATALSNQVRAAAKHSDAAWLVLSQLSRQTGDEHTRPKLSHLRDSGAIEQDAYAVWFLWEPQERDYTNPTRDVEMIIAKNRGGALGRIGYLFTPGSSQWLEGD